MDEIAITPEVTAVLRDLTSWHAAEVWILQVESTADHGVHLGVSGLTRATEQQLRDYYNFPVTCSAGEREPAAPAPAHGAGQSDDEWNRPYRAARDATADPTPELPGLTVQQTIRHSRHRRR